MILLTLATAALAKSHSERGQRTSPPGQTTQPASAARSSPQRQTENRSSIKSQRPESSASNAKPATIPHNERQAAKKAPSLNSRPIESTASHSITPSKGQTTAQPSTVIPSKEPGRSSAARTSTAMKITPPPAAQPTSATRQSATTTTTGSSKSAIKTDRNVPQSVTKIQTPQTIDNRKNAIEAKEVKPDKTLKQDARTEHVTKSRNDRHTYHDTAHKHDQNPAAKSATEKDAASIAIRQKTVDTIHGRPKDIHTRPHQEAADQIVNPPESTQAVRDRTVRIIRPNHTAQQITRSTSTDSDRNRFAPSVKPQDEKHDLTFDARPTNHSETLRADSRREPIRRLDASTNVYRHGSAFQSRSPDAQSSRVVIRGDDNIIVEGKATANHPRPHIPHHQSINVNYIRNNPHWRHHGSAYVFHWSNLSCGNVAVVPYSNYHGLTVSVR
jgi:hypothetical protein